MTVIVCRFVCRQWRDLLPLPSLWPIQEGGKKYDFAQQAARAGHLTLVAWARQYGCPLTRATFQAAGEFGNMGVIQWLYENNCPKEAATYGCNFRKFECFGVVSRTWFPNQKLRCVRGIAAFRGHIEVLEWMKENGRLEIDRMVYELAVMSVVPHFKL